MPRTHLTAACLAVLMTTAAAPAPVLAQSQTFPVHPGHHRRDPDAARPAPRPAGHPRAAGQALSRRDPVPRRHHRSGPPHHPRAPDHPGRRRRSADPALSQVPAGQPRRHRPDPAAVRPDRDRQRPADRMAARHARSLRLPPRHPGGRDQHRGRVPAVDPARQRQLARADDPGHGQSAVGEGPSSIRRAISAARSRSPPRSSCPPAGNTARP